MRDMMLRYRECGAECREDYLRGLANDNGVRFECVKAIAERLGERQDFGLLVRIVEERMGGVR
jgi:hypothetical protein